MFTTSINRQMLMTFLAGLIFTAHALADELEIGENTYQKTCKICHASGAAGAPKLGDKDAWAERSKKGLDALSENAIKGFKGKIAPMPPKGGNPKLTDEEVMAAVKYMLDSSM